jgi:LPXTG-motif cell wall-anchored protein
MTGPGATLLSLLMIAAFAMFAGGAWIILRRREIRQGALMIVAGLVMLGNVLVWVL